MRRSQYRYGTILPAIFLLLATSAPIKAARHEEARLTAVNGDVKVIDADATERAAITNDIVRDDETIKAGVGSRAELLFQKNLLARLPANSALSFKGGRRYLSIPDGAVLFQAPSSAHGSRLCAGGIAVAIAGTTVVFEHHSSAYKLLVLQGTARVYRPRHLGDSILVQPGQMVIGDANGPVAEPVDFDSARFVKTCRLITDFAPLPTAPGIARESARQARAKGKKKLFETNLVIFGSGTAVSLTDPGPAAGAESRPPAAPGTPLAPPPPAPNSDSLGTLDTARGISR